MSTTQKYYVSQILAIPLVALPTLIGGFLLGDMVRRHLKVEADIVALGLMFACMLGLAWTTGRLTGIVLCKIGFLPRGAHRIYPQARSWREYESKKPSKAP